MLELEDWKASWLEGCRLLSVGKTVGCCLLMRRVSCQTLAAALAAARPRGQGGLDAFCD